MEYAKPPPQVKEHKLNNKAKDTGEVTEEAAEVASEEVAEEPAEEATEEVAEVVEEMAEEVVEEVVEEVAEPQLVATTEVPIGEVRLGALVELPNDVSLYKITAKDQDLATLIRQGPAADGSLIDLNQRPVSVPLQCLVKPK